MPFQFQKLLWNKTQAPFFIFMAERLTRCTWGHPILFHSTHRHIHTLSLFLFSPKKEKNKNMSQFSGKLDHSSSTIRRRIHHRVSLLQRCILRVLHRILICPGKKPDANATYSMLPPHATLPSPSPPPDSAFEHELEAMLPPVFHTHDLDSDLVSLKISLLGDCQIGKTSFLVCPCWILFICKLVGVEFYFIFALIYFKFKLIFLTKKIWFAGEIRREWKREWRRREERGKSNGQNIGCERGTYIILYLGSTRYSRKRESI